MGCACVLRACLLCLCVLLDVSWVQLRVRVQAHAVQFHLLMLGEGFTHCSISLPLTPSCVQAVPTSPTLTTLVLTLPLLPALAPVRESIHGDRDVLVAPCLQQRVV